MNTLTLVGSFCITDSVFLFVVNVLMFCVSSWSNLCLVIFIMRGVCPHYPGCLICWHTIIYPFYFCKAYCNVLTFISNFSYLSLSLSFWLKVCQFHCCFQRIYFCFCWFPLLFFLYLSPLQFLIFPSGILRFLLFFL